MADVYTPLTVTSINNLIGTPTLVGDESALSDGLASTYVDLNLGETVQLLYSDVPDSGDVQLVLRAESIATTGTGLPTFNIQFILDSIGTTLRGQFGEQEGYELGTGDRYYVFTLTPDWYASLTDAPGGVWGKLSESPPTWGEFWALFRAEGRLQVQATRSSVGLTSLTTRVYEARLGVGDDLAVTCQTETFEQGSVDGETPEPVTADNTIITFPGSAWVFTANGRTGQGAQGSGTGFWSLGRTADEVHASVDYRPVAAAGPGMSRANMLVLWTGAVDDESDTFGLQLWHTPSESTLTMHVYSDALGDDTDEHSRTLTTTQADQWFHVEGILTGGVVTFLVWDESGGLFWAPPPMPAHGLQVSAVSTGILDATFNSYTARVDNMQLCGPAARPVIRQYPSTAASAWGGGPRQYPAPSRRPFGGFQ